MPIPFLKRSLLPGWLVLRLDPQRVELAHLRPAERDRPQVALCQAYRKEGSDAESLARLNKELRLRNYRRALVLRPGEYQLLQVDAPPVPAAELAEAARWAVKGMLDYPVESATVNALEIPAEAGRPRSVYVVAARNEVIAARMGAFEAAGIPLDVIDIPETAQRNVAALLEEEGYGLALLVFDDTGGLLTFTFGGELYLSRRMEVRLDDAQPASPQWAQIEERVALELQRSLDHFDRQYRHIPMAKLLVLGPMPQAERLSRYLAENLPLRTEMANVGAALDCSASPELREPAQQARWLHVLGAGLREEAAR